MTWIRGKDRVEQALCQLFPAAWLEAQAQQTGLIQRHRKVNPIALFWTLVLTHQRFRLVGVKNPLTRTYPLSLTPIAPDQLTAQTIAPVYSARRLVEILFKALKSSSQREGFPSPNRPIVPALIYRAPIAMLVRRRLEQALRPLIAAKEANARPWKNRCLRSCAWPPC